MILKLRKEHLDAFEAQVVSQFLARVLGHVKLLWPAECAELGEPALTELVRRGIARAGVIGLTFELDVTRFVDLYFILGKDFETSPHVPWIRTILADRTLSPPAKIDQLYKRMEVEFDLIEKRRGGRI